MNRVLSRELKAASVSGDLRSSGEITQSLGRFIVNLPVRFVYITPFKASSIFGKSRLTEEASFVPDGDAAPFSGKLIVRISPRFNCIFPYDVSTSILSADTAVICPTIFVPSFSEISSASALPVPRKRSPNRLAEIMRRTRPSSIQGGLAIRLCVPQHAH